MSLGTIVVDIPIEEQASEKAQEISLAYEEQGWIDRSAYTWVLYARSGMPYSQLEGFRDRIIKAAQAWKADHGLEEKLFDLIVALARAGVIWRPVAPVAELQGEASWLWKRMGLGVIYDEALTAAGIALRVEAASIREKVAMLDEIPNLVNKIVMGPASAVLARAKKEIAWYLEERNRTVELIYKTYQQMTGEVRAKADEMMEKIRGDDLVVRESLDGIGMKMADFGKVVPAVGLGAVAFSSVVLVLAMLATYLVGLVIWHIRTRTTLGGMQIQSLKDLRVEAYGAIDAERASKIVALPPELSAEERQKRIAEIDSWAGAERVKIADSYAKQITLTTSLITARRRIKPWMWAAGGILGATGGLYLAYRGLKSLRKPAVARPKVEDAEAKEKARRAAKARRERWWAKVGVQGAQVVGAIAGLGVFTYVLWALAKGTAAVPGIPPLVPKALVPPPEPTPPEIF